MPGRRGLSREIVIDAAVGILDEHPGQPLTLATVAQRLGVRTPSLYTHVDGLEDLLQGIAVFGARELAERIGRAAIGRAGSDALEQIAWEYRAFAVERPGVYQLTQRAPSQDDAEHTAAAEEILHILRRVLEPFELSDEEEVHAIRSLRSLVHGFSSLELGGGFGMPVDLDASFTYLTRMFTAQISASSRLNRSMAGTSQQG